MLAIIIVRQFPPSESFRSLVSLESRNGTKPEPEANAFMQLPSASRERLILAPSSNRRPLLCVCEALSEPARSIIESLPTVPTSGFLGSRRSTRTWNTACERDDVTFIASAGLFLGGLLVPACHGVKLWTLLGGLEIPKGPHDSSFAFKALGGSNQLPPFLYSNCPCRG